MKLIDKIGDVRFSVHSEFFRDGRSAIVSIKDRKVSWGGWDSGHYNLDLDYISKMRDPIVELLADGRPLGFILGLTATKEAKNVVMSLSQWERLEAALQLGLFKARKLIVGDESMRGFFSQPRKLWSVYQSDQPAKEKPFYFVENVSYEPKHRSIFEIANFYTAQEADAFCAKKRAE